MKPTFEELLAFELNWEPAIAAALKKAGLTVVDPFIAVNPATGEPLANLPDDCCDVRFEPGETDDTVKAFRHDNTGVVVDAISVGWSGVIVITRTVPMDDGPEPVGEARGPYRRLCREIGRIRAIMISQVEQADPFEGLLPWYSILSITTAQPDRRVDQPRSANEATLRFPVRFMPKREYL